jgi:hypothetical protein
MHKFLRVLKILPKTIVPKTFKELEAYPEREERKDDAEYQRAHRILVEVEKHPCFWCGKTLEEVKAEGNTLETHHWAEQSLWKKFDPGKVYKDLMRLNFHDHAKDLPDNPADLHANHISNLVVSCSPCHRENGYGLHGATIPFVWARRWLKNPNDDVLQRWKPLHVHIKNAIRYVFKKKG